MKNGRLLLTTVLSSLMMCSCITHGYSDSVEIRADSRLEKLRIADAIVNDEHLHLFRRELKVLLPDVPEEDLVNLRLERIEQQLSESTTAGAAETVRVIVSLQISGTRDPKPIVEAAVELVKADAERLRRAPL
jgi:hypothetical protein